ncbi:MAG: hypothetical protein NT033_03980, partial [Candidatus Omnitrophica bacterium]|nr:hypothetical protein [Candidatus Omnitrophota bacterium]
KQILIHTTKNSEKIFIRFPGKESAKHTLRGTLRKPSAIRPWDFRPKISIQSKNTYLKDMSFGDIWAIVFETAELLIKDNKKEILRIFATLLYRIATMDDHINMNPFNTKEQLVKFKSNSEVTSKETAVQLPEIYQYSINPQVLEFLTEECPLWGAMSSEGFLSYNEALAWNEDCKYYYRNIHVTETNKWIASTGRVNTLLTHIRILGYILGEVPLAEIFNDFAVGKGVSPASDDEILTICKGYVHR